MHDSWGAEMSNKQHRHFARIPFDADTRVAQGGQAWKVELLDISLNGILCKQPDDWQIHPGRPLQVVINLVGRVRIMMEVELVHITKTEAGCHCLHVDIDSITNLKRLVALNVGSDTFLERELQALVDDHVQHAKSA